MRQIIIVLFIVLFTSFFCTGQTTGGQTQTNKPPAYVVSLNFETNAVSPYGAIELADGDILEVKILNLPGEDIEITVNGILQEKKEDDGIKGPTKTATVSIQIIHRSEMAAYQVMIKHTTTQLTRGWIIPVITTHWTVDFSGAFTIDALGRPSYYLEPGIKDDEHGFYVRKNEDSSKFGLGTAAMVHLYYNKRSSKMKVIPITFGIGVGTGSNVRYYIGPSLRFGGAGYLTLGVVLGDVDKPPVNAPLNSFVTDANALANITNKKKFHLFLGFSYSFIGSNAQQRLQQPFALPTGTSNHENNNSEGEPSIIPPIPPIPAFENRPVIENVIDNKEDNTIIITGLGFGNNKANTRVNAWLIDNEETNFNKTGDQIKEIDDNKIIFDIDPTIKGDYHFVVVVNGIKSETYGPVVIGSNR